MSQETYTIADHIAAMAECGAPYQIMGQGLYQQLLDVDWDAFEKAKARADELSITSSDIYKAMLREVGQ